MGKITYKIDNIILAVGLGMIALSVMIGIGFS